MLWQRPERRNWRDALSTVGGLLRDNTQGFLLMTLRARSLRTELLESLSDHVVVLNNIILLLSCRPLFALRFGALAVVYDYAVSLSPRFLIRRLKY